MPKSADVTEFAAKLGLLTKRLNWSRSRLAQAVGVDKSLVARWAKGASRPTENSLMQLTTAAAKLVDGFTAADWDLAPADFAKRLGLDAASVAVPPPKGGDGGLADLAFPAAFRDFTLNFEWYAGIYAGLYRRYIYSTRNDGSLLVRAFRIWPEAGVLRYETHAHSTPVRGICIGNMEMLTFLGQTAVGAGVSFGIVNGTLASPPRLLSGIFASRATSNERAVGAGMAVLEFVERLPEAPEAAHRRWQELISQDRQIERDDSFGDALPREIADLLDVRVSNKQMNIRDERRYVVRAAKP